MRSPDADATFMRAVGHSSGPVFNLRRVQWRLMSFLRSPHAALSCLVIGGLLAGCPGSGNTADAGLDAPPERCDIDTTCPEEAPLSGGPCAGTLSCDYNTCGGGPFADTYTCASGQWMLSNSMCLGAPPVLAELCRTPTTSWPAGARFVLTPDAAGAAPYTDGQAVDVVIGIQGGAMVPYRVRIEGLDATPTCLHATATLTTDDGMTATSEKFLRLRCGSTLRIYEILPLCPTMGEHDTTLEVTVEGLGTQTVHLAATNAEGCPRSL